MGWHRERGDKRSFQEVKNSLYFDQGKREIIKIHQTVCLRLHFTQIASQFLKSGEKTFLFRNTGQKPDHDEPVVDFMIFSEKQLNVLDFHEEKSARNLQHNL